MVILLVIIIVLAIGGVLYYVTKSSNISSTNIENNLPLENQIVNNKNTDCLPTTKPWVKVISPNGGETYIAGQKITVKWESCNIVGNNYEQSIYLSKPSNFEAIPYRLARVAPGSAYINSPATFDLPTDLFGNNINISVTYSERINGVSSGKSYEGHADKPFTVNSSTTINLRKLNETCGDGIGSCVVGLKCFYPCGVSGCQSTCVLGDPLPRP